MPTNINKLQKNMLKAKTIPPYLVKEIEGTDIKRIFLYKKSLSSTKLKQNTQVTKTSGTIKKSPPVLPKLAGILLIKRLNKKPEYRAIIEGKTYRINDKIKEFTIKEINSKGIVLTKGSDQWFISYPQLFYSIDKGT